jgi:hypothetical protein
VALDSVTRDGDGVMSDEVVTLGFAALGVGADSIGSGAPVLALPLGRTELILPGTNAETRCS